MLKNFLPCGKQDRADASALQLPDSIQAIHQKALLGYHLEQVLWGKALLNSTFMPPDPQQAIIWFTMAANAGYGPAHNMLGRCHHFGWGCDKNLTEAASHYAKAAELGDEWGRYNLGILTMRGIGMPQNLPKAFDLFQTAANNNHAKSMNILGRFYEEGWVVGKDVQAAHAWYQRSAETGDYRGCHNHATVLAERGQLEDALDWWDKALPDATSDILLAMQRSLSALDMPRARTLLVATQARLAAVLPATENTPDTDAQG